jgi:hypothetical protein
MSQNQDHHNCPEAEAIERIKFAAEACCPMVFGQHMTDHEQEEQEVTE